MGLQMNILAFPKRILKYKNNLFFAPLFSRRRVELSTLCKCEKHVFLDCQACRASAQLRFPHQKSIFFRTWIVQRSFCDKFIARQGKSTVNTWCINEHFDEVLRRIYCKNRTRFESPTAKQMRQYPNSPELSKIAVYRRCRS